MPGCSPEATPGRSRTRTDRMAPGQNDPSQEKVGRRAHELLEGGDEGHEPEDEAAAEKAAARLLEESEERTSDPAARDPHDDRVIRRSSEETEEP